MGGNVKILNYGLVFQAAHSMANSSIRSANKEGSMRCKRALNGATRQLAVFRAINHLKPSFR
jgi:hypothetical protein